MAVSPQIPAALLVLDYFGIAVFAISGALLAAEKRQTLVTFIFFAVVTGVGGGTVRDLLIGAPVFWVHTNATLLICIAAGLLVWLTSSRRLAGQALLWFDAAGLGAYATYGAAKALAFGVSPIPAFAMGVLTVLCRRDSSRCARRRALDPDAARALCHGRRPRRRPVRGARPFRHTAMDRGRYRRARWLRPPGCRHRPRLVATRISKLGCIKFPA